MYVGDYRTVNFKCGYKPCGHEGQLTFYKNDMSRYEVKQCPKCKVWNYKHLMPDLSELVKE